ncbi:hypothetical protein APHAL10511_005971 [Amanita phalloides]|nr:hypothetical protein APHAL10511_005971 [Amanita phalloides]
MSGRPRPPAHKPSQMDLSHLLNFSLPPRPSRPIQSLPRRSRRIPNSHGVWNKERFVNAQYRFIMNPTGDYTVHFADPDIYFQWQDIIQVIIPRSSALAHAAARSDAPAQSEGVMTCPICLSSPVAPRMTKCGHVYCFSCILQYLGMSDNKWARCPICFDSVSEKHLKCVKWYDTPIAQEDERDEPLATAEDGSVVAVPKAGSVLRMRLVQRPQITTLALPRSCTWPSDLIPPHQAPFHFIPDVFAFSKFMLATPSYLIADLTKDLDDLAAERRALAQFNDTLALSFIDGADEKIRHEIAKVAALDSLQLQERIEKAIRDQHELEERFVVGQRWSGGQEPVAEAVDDIPIEFLVSKGQGVSTLATAPPPPNSRNMPKHRRNLNPPPPSTNTYFYYQAASGLPIFLHPLDIKILLSHFSSYSSFPDNITVRVEACSEGTVNDELRKRCKYLAHLPESADVVFVEADVSGVVGAEGLKNFENALKMRSARRKDKERKDDRAKARAEERERDKERTHDASWGAASQAVQSLASDAAVVPAEELSESFPSATQQGPPAQTAGAWGSRSFASALHTPVSQPRPSPPARREDEDFWDDIAWHELERSANSGGRKKRGAKLVLGGAGSGRRR